MPPHSSPDVADQHATSPTAVPSSSLSVRGHTVLRRSYSRAIDQEDEAGEEEQEMLQQHQHSLSHSSGRSIPSRGPTPIHIAYPPLPIAPQPTSTTPQPWYPTSAGRQHEASKYDGEHTFPYLKSRTGTNAHPSDAQIQAFKHGGGEEGVDAEKPTSPLRARRKSGGGSTHSSPTKSPKSSSRSPSRHDQHRSTKSHDYLRSHTGGHAHPDLPIRDADRDEEGPNRMEFHLFEDRVDYENSLGSSPIPPIQLSPTPPTRYPFHHSVHALHTVASLPHPPSMSAPPIASNDLPRGSNIELRHFSNSSPIPSSTSSIPYFSSTSSMPTDASPEALASYIERVRSQPPQPPSASANLQPPQPWWMNQQSAATSAPSTQTSVSHSQSTTAAAPSRNSPPPPHSTASQLRAMEEQIQLQRDEKLRAREEELRRRQENVERMERELKVEQEREVQRQQEERYQHQQQQHQQQHEAHSEPQFVSHSSHATAPNRSSLDSLNDLDEDFSMLEGLDPTSLLALSPRSSPPQEQHHRSRMPEPPLSNQERAAASPRQHSHAHQHKFDDKADHSRTSLSSSTHPIPPFRAPPSRTSFDSRSASPDVDDLLRNWRVSRQHTTDRSSRIPHSTRTSNLYDSPSPRRHRENVTAGSPEVEQLIQRLKRRLGLNEEEEEEDAKYSNRHSRPTAESSFEHHPTSRHAFASLPQYRTPLSDILSQPKLAEEDYLRSSRKSGLTPPTPVVPAVNHSPTVPTQPAFKEERADEPTKSTHAVNESTQEKPSEEKKEAPAQEQKSNSHSTSDSNPPAASHTVESAAAPTTSSLPPLHHASTSPHRTTENRSSRRTRKEKRLPPQILIHITPTLGSNAIPQPVSFSGVLEPLPELPIAPVANVTNASVGVNTSLTPNVTTKSEQQTTTTTPSLSDPASSHAPSSPLLPVATVSSPPHARAPRDQAIQVTSDVSDEASTELALDSNPPAILSPSQSFHTPRKSPPETQARVPTTHRSPLFTRAPRVNDEEEKKGAIEFSLEMENANEAEQAPTEVEPTSTVAPLFPNETAVMATAIPSYPPTSMHPYFYPPTPAHPFPPHPSAYMYSPFMMPHPAMQMPMPPWHPSWYSQPMHPYHQFPPPAHTHPFFMPPQLPTPSAPVPVAPSPPSPPLATQSSFVSPTTNREELTRLCRELGMTIEEYDADPPLQLLVHQLQRLHEQQAQVKQMNADKKES